MVSSSAAPVHRTRPRSGPRCVSTTAWTSLAATKPGPRPTTSRASSIRVPRLRLAILASTTTAGRSRASDEPSGSTTTGTNLRSSRTDGTWSRTTRRPGTPSTSAGPARTASAKATLRRTARGCSLSRTATRNPHRKSRRAAAEAISPPPRTTTSSGRGTRALIARTLPADLETARQLHLHGAYGGGIHPAADRDHLGQDAHRDLFRALGADLDAQRRVHPRQLRRGHAPLLEVREDVDHLGPAAEQAHEAQVASEHGLQGLGVALVAAGHHHGVGVAAQRHAGRGLGEGVHHDGVGL